MQKNSNILEYSTNSDFEEKQELKYSMDFSTNSSENTDSELSSNFLIAEKEILIGVLVDIVGQWRQRCEFLL